MIALDLQHIAKRFHRTPALADASLTARAGTIHALLGENGAGKSTLMRIAYGLEQPDDGRLLVRGTPHTFRGSADAIRAGIGMVHQHYMLVDALTVAENIALGGHGRFDPSRAAAQAQAHAQAFSLDIDPAVPAGELSVAAQQRVELLKALARNADILILDEPTAVLPPQEGRQLYAHLRALADAGRCVILITHKVHEALACADDVTVLRRGRTALASRVADTTVDAVVAALLGPQPPPQDFPDRTALRRSGAATAASDVVLALREVSYQDARGIVRVRNASLAIHRGEIVGLAGTEGSGHAELLRLLAGRLAPTRGTVRRPARIGFVPEDRLRDALIPSLSLSENFALHGAGDRSGIISWRTMARKTGDALARFHIQDATPASPAGALSGGNQQRFVLARELADAPDALIAESPVRGLDIRATADVVAFLRTARDSGMAVVVFSRDLDELLPLADRMLVTCAGTVQEVPLDAERIGRALLGDCA